jgi:hypothetical protein
MSELRKALVKLAHRNPDGIQKHLLPLLKQAGTELETFYPEFDRIIESEVEDAGDDCDWERDVQILTVSGMRGYKFGSGSDGGYAAQTMTDVSYMESTGYWGSGAVEKAAEAANEKCWQEALDEYKGRFEEEGLGADPAWDDIYNVSPELAEEFEEYLREWQQEEEFIFRVGAFFYGPDNSSPWHPNPNGFGMHVFATVDFYGRFLGQKTISLYEEDFGFKDAKDLNSKLKTALGKAATECGR